MTIPCQLCGGKGRHFAFPHSKLCPLCGGHAELTIVGNPQLHICPVCKGSGRDFAFPNSQQCPTCAGLGRLTASRRPPDIVIDGHAASSEPPAPSSELTLIAEGRLSELRSLKSSAFDFKKLIRLCEELNVTYHEKCYFATAMLTRSLLDHVPPLFERKNFDEVASNYGGRSFKGTMQHLQSASRNVADGHLHQQIRNSEVLPTAQQVNCAQQLDALLEEIVRITKGQRRYSLRAGVILFFLFKKTPRTAGQVNGIVPSVRFIFHWHLVRAIAD